ncbi:MAG TPA: MBL fold metallo-hydrolase, partial [Geobacteraceae bacterium]|nr:MBL fold metallo-hydrolase [Geobacteraceae bacterium]
MKRFVVLSFLIMFAMSCHTVFAQEGLMKIAENVYSYVGVKNAGPANSFAANAGIVVGKDGIAVIDTLISAKEAQRFIRDIRKISDKPIRYVVDTHHHLDHTFGNEEFSKLGAVIVSQEECRKNMLKYSEETQKNARNYGLTPEQTEGTKIAYPTITFTDRMSIDLGNQEIELIYVGPSHTGGSIMVLVPDRKVLFTGDILFTDFHPFLADGDIPGWVRNLDYIATLDVDRIVPGHGPISGKKDIAEMKNYLIAFDEKARELSTKSSDVAA